VTLTPTSSRSANVAESDLAGYEFDYAEITANVAVTAVAEATPDDVVALPARVYDGATVILLEFFASAVLKGDGGGTVLNLWDGAVDLGRFCFFGGGYVGDQNIPTFVAYRLTPSAASHTYSVKAWRFGADGQVTCAAPFRPCYLRAVRAVSA
jgi:hypothetical protein